jgi:hydroxymethylpyrimidine pyrophosphatase-like HAD family hydrolase
LRYFGDDIDQRDLQKLLDQKSPLGKLNCTAFTNWVGESIHQREGFYFRHDSMKNPRFENHMKKNEKIQKFNFSHVKNISEKEMSKIQKFIQKKFAIQWSTL